MSDLPVKGKLDPLQFYKWRLSIEKLNHAKTQKALNEHKIGLMKKEIELSQIKMMKFVDKYRADAAIKIAESEYNELKSGLEKELGFSLNNCSINEFTFEVNDLEGEENG